MAPRRQRETEIPEPDRVPGYPHPRETLRLVGHEQVLSRIARALRAGRPPHGWLITGPPGIGKATLAYRIARYLLAYGASDRGAADLSVPPNEAASIQVAAGSHPGLLVLRRAINPKTGRLMTVISVDEIRRLGGFFGMTSGAGGWRVAIVDTADDMNDNAANALLKQLEEPPSRAVLILLSNMPGRLLPTIRSRCQRLDLRPLDDALVAAELARLLPGLSPSKRSAVAQLADGSIGLGLQLGAGDGVALAEEADKLIGRATTPDVPGLIALGDRLARSTDGIDAFGGFLQQALTGRIRARAHDAAPHLDRWLDCLAKVETSFRRTDALNLDPRQTVLSAARSVAAAARRAGGL
jgi:DNA polymerase-3 subunit delta'